MMTNTNAIRENLGEWGKATLQVKLLLLCDELDARRQPVAGTERPDVEMLAAAADCLDKGSRSKAFGDLVRESAAFILALESALARTEPVLQAARECKGDWDAEETHALLAAIRAYDAEAGQPVHRREK